MMADDGDKVAALDRGERSSVSNGGNGYIGGTEKCTSVGDSDIATCAGGDIQWR